MKPALTKEEWGKKEFTPSYSYWGMVALGDTELSVRCPDNREIFKEKDQHKLAALCLHDQLFGFTREDVRELRETAESSVPSFSVDERRVLEDIADRIEALLPPEVPDGP